MQILQIVEAFIPLLFPLGIVRGHCLFRQEIVDSRAGERVTCATGTRGVVSKAARIILHPLLKLLPSRGRVRNLLRVVCKDNGCAAVRLHVISCDRALCLYRSRIRNLGPVQLDKSIFADLRNNLGKVVAAPVNDIIVGVSLTRLNRSSNAVGQGLCAGTGKHKLQLNLILVGILGIGVEILDQCLKNGADVVRSGCPEGYSGLAVSRSVVAASAAAAAGQSGSHHGAGQQYRT